MANAINVLQMAMWRMIVKVLIMMICTVLFLSIVIKIFIKHFSCYTKAFDILLLIFPS